MPAVPLTVTASIQRRLAESGLREVLPAAAVLGRRFDWALRDLGLAWRGPAVVLELTGQAGRTWALGAGTPVATARVDAVTYLRTLSGRDDSPALEIDGDQTVADMLTMARVVF